MVIVVKLGVWRENVLFRLDEMIIIIVVSLVM